MHRISITVCYRPLPVHRGQRHVVSKLLEQAGHTVVQVSDGPCELSTDVVWLMENANFFPTIVKRLAAVPARQRPLVVVWHWEPLPPPRSAGVRFPPLHAREIAKIILRDPRATDVYTNYARLRRMSKQGLPDLLVLSAIGWRDFLAERGIHGHWVPIGSELADGHCMELRRDIDALFLGCLDVPRRVRIIRQLRREGLGLLTKGSWYDKTSWGSDRTRLINRAKVFLNVQRQPGEIAAHRLILGMVNKALVVSEPISTPAPFVAGKHYVSAHVDDMADVIGYYVAHADERKRIAAAGHALVTRELTMARSVSDILQLIEQRLNHRRGFAAHFI